MPKLTFVMPTHNPDPVLFPKVLKAIIEQSLKDWDIVFAVDGDWPDAKREIAKAFKKCPNHYKVVELPAGGAQIARNEGFKRAEGEYISFFDCDSIIEPHTAKAWVDLLDANPQYGFIYSGYKFLGEKGAINSEPFDPFMLRVRNYISGHFPVRREFVKPWNESLLSLQDWDFWLGVVERGGVGKYLPGYAFSTAYPTPTSISGKGCTKETWLSRMDAVRAIHGIEAKTVCVTSLHNRLDGIALAKAIGADYDDAPNFKPNHYKTIVQLGFSFKPGEMEACSANWTDEQKKVLFWMPEDVEMVEHGLSKSALKAYSKRINVLGRQFVEDTRAKELMVEAGFAVEVLPLPVISTENVAPLPAEPKFLVDASGNYGHIFAAIEQAIPDIKLETMQGVKDMDSFTGLICFHQDRLLRPSVKRMIAAGRHVLSNIQAPFAGFTEDRSEDGPFIKGFVEKVRALARKPQNIEAVRYYIDPKKIERVLEVVK